MRNHISLIVVLIFSALASSAIADPPNVLFIITDDQAFDAVHSLGWNEVETPNMDHLVRQGTTFTHVYNQGSWSGAVCVASRTMLFTGKSLWHANRDVKQLKSLYVEKGLSWPQRMKAAGYRTCMTGKWHVKADTQQVFDEVRNVRPGMPHDKAFMYNRPHEGQADSFDPADKRAGGFWEGGKHWSEIIADDAIAMLDAPQNDERPFFIYIAFNAPHDPRQSPASYVARYPRNKMQIPSSYQPLYPYAEEMGAGTRLRDERLAPFPRTEYAIQAHRAEYAAIITHLDDQIGRILAALEERGLGESTRIVFTSDHGLAIGRHGLLGKQNMYDHSVRVPFVMVGPSIPKGKRIDQRVYMQDVVPTTLAWANANHEGIEFQNLMPLVEGQKDKARGAIYGAYLKLQRMITREDWKLIVYPKANVVRLYNVTADPEELKDLADDPEHQDRIRELLDTLIKTQQELDDPLSLTLTLSEG